MEELSKAEQFEILSFVPARWQTTKGSEANSDRSSATGRRPTVGEPRYGNPLHRCPMIRLARHAETTFWAKRSHHQRKLNPPLPDHTNRHGIDLTPTPTLAMHIKQAPSIRLTDADFASHIIAIVDEATMFLQEFFVVAK